MPQVATAKKGQEGPKEFSLAALIRSGLRDPSLRVGADEGSHERRISQALEGLQPAGLVGRSYGASHGPGTYFLPCPPRAAGQRVDSIAGGGALVGGAQLTLTDALRPISSLERLGARVIPVMDGEVRAGKMFVGLPARIAGGWVREDEAVSLPEAFRVAAASAGLHDCATRIQLSRHLLRHVTPATEQQLRQLLADSVGDTIEQGSIAGSGQEAQPLGLLNTEDVPRSPKGSPVPGPHELAAAFKLVADQPGADPRGLAILASTADLDAWLLLERLGGNPLVTGDPQRGFRAFSRPIEFSNLVPSGQTVVGDFRWLSLVYYGSPSLIVNPYVSSAHNEVEINYRQSMGIAIERLNMFCKLGG